MTTKKDKNLITRPPVVVILGHVDHGKSSILESIKDLKITEKESGGITQHIGAYEVEHLSAGSGQAKKITFLDTPGHEAFSAIRSRGAKVADIAILVVAAEEGIKAQTKEAVRHIKKAGLPLIVALNKIDKPESNPEKVKRELAKEDILVESMGGKIPSVNISTKTGQGIADLLELILLVAEMEDLRADITKKGEGVVIEAYLDSLRGPTATLLLNTGTLKTGDIIATPSSLGKLKILENFQREKIEKALPSMPIITIGFDQVPHVGEKFKAYPDLESAMAGLERKEKREEREVFLIEPEKKVLNLILKTDVLGSLEAVEGVLKNFPQEKITLRILKKEVGETNESDVKLARAAGATILAFRVKVNRTAQELAQREKIRILLFEVIYDLAQGTRQLMERLIKPEIVRKDAGKIKILMVFSPEKNRQIIGGKTIEGEIKKGLNAEIHRNEEKIGQGKIINLQKNKKDAEKCLRGEECGIMFEGNAKVAESDVLFVYTEEKIKGEL